MRSAQWSVRVGIEAPAPAPTVFPTVVVAGVAPRRAPRLTELYPKHKVASRQSSDGRERLDHVRLVRGVELGLLPGLDSDEPSLVRDTVRVLLEAGAPTVDVVLAQHSELLPWSIGTLPAFRVLAGTLETLTAVPVLFPDAAGPARVGLREPPLGDRLTGLVHTVRTWTGPLRRAYQIGLVDLPPGPEAALTRACEALGRSDFAIASWEGGGSALRAHGWRNASAVVGALLATTSSPADSLTGRPLTLPRGRSVESFERARELGAPEPVRTVPGSLRDGVAVVRLLGDDRVELVSEPSLRGIPGTWPLPLLHAVKLVHDRVVFAANLFVFREATASQAFLLQSALRMAVREFEDIGVLTGPTPSEPVLVEVGHASGPDAPSLVARVTGFVRPWVRELVVNVAVRPGQVVRSEVET